MNGNWRRLSAALNGVLAINFADSPFFSLKVCEVWSGGTIRYVRRGRRKSFRKSVRDFRARRLYLCKAQMPRNINEEAVQ